MFTICIQSKDISDILPYIGKISDHNKAKHLKFCNQFCKEKIDIELFLLHTKLRIIFHIKTLFLEIFPGIQI